MKNGPGDTWRTPKSVISYIEGRFGEIQIDLCSSDKNKVCETNLNEKDNFLDSSWLQYDVVGVELGVNLGELAFCNPPYSGPLPFVKQCVKWDKHGYAVAGILNFDPSTKWFIELINANAMIMPIIGGRASFLDGEGKPSKGNNKPQFMFYLAPFLAQSVRTEYVHINEVQPKC